MKTVLHELSMLPGVIGSCINVDNTIPAASLPASFSRSMAKDAANSIRRMIQMAKVKGLAPASMSIRYDKFTVLAVPVTDISLLLVLCSQDDNISLVATTASMLVPEIEKKIKQPQPEEIVIPAPLTPKEPEYINAETSKALKQVKTALFETVGPIADVIYEDCFLRWTENKPADIGRIFELLACIAKDLDNDGFFAEFKDKIASLL